MERGLRIRQNDRGEWTVVDLHVGYRICAYQAHHHGGVHIHASGRTHRTGLRDLEEAWRAALAYRVANDRFDAETFEEWVDAWRSGSRPS